MRYRLFFSAVLALLSCSVDAESFSDSDELRSQIETFLGAELHAEYREADETDFEISVSNLDPRLKLSQCDAPVVHTIVSPRPYGTHISVKAQCSGSKPWTIYVPAKIDTYAPVVVTVRNLERGSIVTDADVTLTRMNTGQAGAGHVRIPGEIVGLEIKRRLGAGEPVRMSHVKAPQLVRKGDRVVMEAGNAGILVVTSGRALANGQMGEQIRVQNEKSQRIVDAEVVAPGRVRVAL